MSATWISNLPEFIRKDKEARRQGMLAAAKVLQRAVRYQLRRGFTSGEFVTGKSEAAVSLSDPFMLGAHWNIVVGSMLKSNLQWELGHVNIFLKRYVRVERWRMAWINSVREQAEAYGRAYKRAMSA